MPKNRNVSAQTTANSTAQLINSGNDVFNNSTGSFDYIGLDNLATSLLGSGKRFKDLVDAGKAGDKNSADFYSVSSKDVTVKLGGFIWTPVYLSKSVSGDAVLTLWLTDSAQLSVKTSPFAVNTSGSGWSGTGNYPSAMYGKSYVRIKMLNAGGQYATSASTLSSTIVQDPSNEWAKFTMPQSALGSSVKSIVKYLATPAEMEWQALENANKSGYAGFDSTHVTMSNESYLKNGETSASGVTFTSTYHNPGANTESKDGYSDWKNDYVWLPSMVEIGQTAATVPTGSVWQCTATQRESSADTFVRSMTYDMPTRTFKVKADGGIWYPGTTAESNAIRPCIHVNLSSIGHTVEDVEVTYNGGPQTLADVAADDKTWYDSSVMNLTYLTASMKDVGTYTVKVELTAAAIAAGEEFLGDPDPSKGGGDESATLRYFNFKIKPKTLNATLAESGGIVSLTLNSSDLCGTDSLPPTAIRYTSTDGKGYNSTIAPKQKGSFKAEPEITATKSNYSLKSTPASVTFTISAIQVDMPTMPPTAKFKYDGTTQTVTLLNYTHDGMGVSIYEVSGKTASGKAVATAPTFNATGGQISFKDAGVYTVTFVLEDTSNCVWKSDGTNGRKDITFTVDRKQLALTLSNDNGDLWAWGVGTKIETTVALSGIESGDSVTLKTKYSTSAGIETSSSGTSNAGATTVSDVYTLPSTLAKGNYTLTAEIDNENYDIADGLATAGMPMTFAIGAQVFDPSTFTWTYSENGIGKTPISDGDSSIKYKLDATGNPYKYKLSINLGKLVSAFATITDSDYTDAEQTDAGTYKTKVKLTITNTDYSFDTTKVYSNATVISTTEAEIYINWSISKGDFTGLDTLPWVYRYGASGSWTDYNPARPPEFGNGTVTVKMKGDVEGTLKGLTFTYGGQASANKKGEYTVNMSFGVKDTKNFNIPKSFNFAWKITKRVINVQWESDVVLTYTGTAHPEWHGNEYLATQLKYEKPEYADKVEYIYSCTLPDGTAYTDRGVDALAYITEQALAANTLVMVDVKVELKSDPSVLNDYEIVDLTGGPVSCGTSFMVGDGKIIAKVDLEAEGEYGSFKYAVNVTGDDMDSTKYTVEVYKGTNITDPDSSDNVKIESFDPKTADAGDYFIVVKLNGIWADEYRLSGSKKAFSILPKKIAVPTLGDVTFTGGELSIAEYLGGSWADYKDIITLGGEFEGIRNVKEGGYVATLTLTSGNYCWHYGSGTSTVKYSLTSEVTAEGTDSVASYKWNVSPLIVDTSNMWSKGKNGAALNLPANIKSLIDAETLTLGYRYYDGASGEFIESPELKGGKSFKVEAAFGGFDAENGNVLFKTGESEFGAVSSAIDYTVPQSGAAAFFGNTLNFVKSNWLWFAIGGGIFLFLLLLIIILAATKRKRKEKAEERKLEKERKAEEKARKEEEKRRREQEREEAKAKAEAERELQKAKAEAELAKMRAEMGMAGAGAMAMQPQQQPMQPQQQAMPQQPQYPQQMPQPYYPQQQPMQSGSDNSVMIQLMQQQLTEMRTQQNASLRAELEMMKMMQNQQHQPIYPQQPYYSQQQPQAGNNGGEISMSALGELVVSALKSMAKGGIQTAERAELPQKTEESAATTVSTPTVYPPDAVITTTTTVDTTKTSANTKQPQRISRDKDNTIFDIDGFYDTFEENK